MAKRGGTAEAGEQTATEQKQKNTTLVSITIPNELKDILDKVAGEADKPTAAYVRELVAKSVNYELPPMTRTRSTTPMTEEERKAKQKEKQHKASALLKALEAGELGGLDLDAILAKYKPAERAPRGANESEANV